MEDLGPGDQSRFARAYWRGERFTRFSDGRWRREWWGDRTDPEPVSAESPTTYSIVYHVFGSDRIFLPVAAGSVSIEPAGRPRTLFSPARDRALYGLTSPIDAPLRARATLALGRSGEFVDSPVSFEAFDIDIDEDVSELFAEFWEGIDPDIARSPNMLAAYIRDDAGFSYSVDAPARDLRSFLYEERQGHCEYFATVLTLTLQHFGYQATLMN